MNEIKNTGDKLSRIKKDLPFKTPEGYFDDFSSRLQQRLELEKREPEPRQRKIIRMLRPVLGLAASFALIFLLVYFPLNIYLSGNLAENSAPLNGDTEYRNMLENLDEDEFFALINENENSNKLSEEDLMLFVSANFNEYELYENLEN